jgi:hypothetical protein
MPKVKDYMEADEFTAWMHEHGWTVKGMEAAGVAGLERNIYRLRSGASPVPKVLVIALPAINRMVPRKDRGGK